MVPVVVVVVPATVLPFITPVVGPVTPPGVGGLTGLILVWPLNEPLAAALELAWERLARRCAGVWAWLFTLPALLPAVALLRSPLEVMPPVLTEPPILFVFNAVAALALALASLLSAPAGEVTWPVVLTPVPSEVPAAPVVAPAPTPPPAVPPTPAAMAGSAARTAPHSTAEMQALFRLLFMIVLLPSGANPHTGSVGRERAVKRAVPPEPAAIMVIW